MCCRGGRFHGRCAFLAVFMEIGPAPRQTSFQEEMKRWQMLSASHLFVSSLHTRN